MSHWVKHQTEYHYAEPVSLCHSVAHVTPRDSASQTCPRSDLIIDPAPAAMSRRLDFFGNQVHYFLVQAPHTTLTLTATSRVCLTPTPRPALERSEAWELVRDVVQEEHTPAAIDAAQFTLNSPCVRSDADLADYAAASFAPGRPVLDAAMDLTRRIHADFRYEPRSTTVSTPVSQVFAQRRGVCQDFAHLQLACLRALGLPARYVSGYLVTAPPAPEQSPSGSSPARSDPPRPGGGEPGDLVGADASHAWVSVYCPRLGWIDFDPTNNAIPSDRHILVAWGRDYGDVSPVKGVILGGGQHSLSVAVEVRAVADGTR